MHRCTKHTKNNNAIVQDVTQKPYKLQTTCTEMDREEKK